MKTLTRRLALALAIAVALAPGSALAHDIVYYDQPHRVVQEGNDSSATVERCCHGTGRATVDWATRTVTATMGVDFEEESAVITFPDPISEGQVRLSTITDDEPEPVEVAQVEVSNADGSPAPTLTFPRTTDFVILDDDGSSRVAFMYPNYSVYSNRKAVTLEVVRLGNTNSELSVGWSTADGTAKKGRHYKAKSGTIAIAAGKRTGPDAVIKVPILDPADEKDTTHFSVLLDVPADPTAGATEADVEIRNLQTGDYQKPFTQFHRPKQGATYGRNHWLAKESHVFSNDGAGSGVKRVSVALRKRTEGGTCSWWTGRRWKRSSCSVTSAQRGSKVGRAVWYASKKPPSGDINAMAIFRYPRLQPTQGTRLKSYRVISRATDFSGNTESVFIKGDNMRDFKIGR